MHETLSSADFKLYLHINLPLFVAFGILVFIIYARTLIIKVSVF